MKFYQESYIKKKKRGTVTLQSRQPRKNVLVVRFQAKAENAASFGTLQWQHV